MKKLLLESVDNESRKNAIKFLINNFERCFPLEMHDKTPEEKKRIAEEYELSVEIRFCDPWNVERACNWTKALVEGLTRILKTECNENSARPENKRMLAQMEKLAFAAIMYRQKQVWDGVPNAQIMSKDANGLNFYSLSKLVMPHYDEFVRMYNDGYRDKWPGKEAFKEIAHENNIRKAAEREARRADIQRRIDAGEEVTDEERRFLDQALAAAARIAAAEAEANNNNNEENAAEAVEDNPWAEHNGFGTHVPYMKGLFKIGNKDYYAVKITKHTQAKTWWYWGWPECPIAGQVGARWCICGPGTHFGGYGIGTSRVAYFIMKKGFENLVRPTESRTAPNDEWGTSLMCLMIDADFGIDSEQVPNFTSRYNHYAPGVHNGMADGDEYGDWFLHKKLDKICELLGCTKEEFVEKFKFKLDADSVDVDMKPILKKISTANLINSRKINFSFNNARAGGYCKIWDRETGAYAIFKDGKFITPWVRSIEVYTNNDKHIFFVTFNNINNTTQVYNENGEELLPYTLDNRQIYHIDVLSKDGLLIVKKTQYCFMIYDLIRRMWLTNKPIYADIRFGYVTNFPNLMLRRVGEDGNYLDEDWKLYKYNFKTKSFAPVEIHLGENVEFRFGYDCGNSARFIQDSRASKKICYIPTGEITEFNEYVSGRSITDYYCWTDGFNEWLNPDGEYFALKDIVGENIMDYTAKYALDKDKVAIAVRTYPDNQNNVYFYVINGKGEKLYEKMIPNNRLSTFKTYNSDYGKIDKLYVTYIVTENDSSKTHNIVINANGQIDEYEIDGTDRLDINDVRYINNEGTKLSIIGNKLYNEKLEEICELPNYRSIRRCRTIDVTASAIYIKYTTTGWDDKDILVYPKQKKIIEMPTEFFMYMGKGYIYVPGERASDPSVVYDDEGRKVIEGRYKFTRGFDESGIASITAPRNRTIFINTDNEYGEVLEELLESMNNRKLERVLNEGMIVKQKLDWLDYAAYLC